MMSEIWELDGSYVAAYTENKTMIENMGHPIMATYYRDGELFAVQFKIPKHSVDKFDYEYAVIEK